MTICPKYLSKSYPCACQVAGPGPVFNPNSPSGSTLGSVWSPVEQNWTHPPGRSEDLSLFFRLAPSVSPSSPQLKAWQHMFFSDPPLVGEPEPPSERPEPETFVGHKVGWRSWAIEPVGDTHTGEVTWRLMPYSQHAIWEPRERHEAKCLDRAMNHMGPAHPDLISPDEGCGCGIWAVKHLIDAPMRAWDRDNLMVFGQVALWGKVIEHELGYRAQYAYPARLWMRLVHGELAKKLHAIYGVPVKVEGHPWLGDNDAYDYEGGDDIWT